MKYWIVYWIALLEVIFLPSHATQIEVDLSLGEGYRVDDLCWTIDTRPHSNVQTKQKWQNVKILETSGRVELTLCKDFFLRVEGDFGWIINGKKHLDEREHDGTGTFSEEGWLEANTHGYVYDVTGGVGYIFPFFCNQLQCIPLVGYAYNVQHFNDDHYSDKIFLLNFFKGIHSHYTYRWMGPWIGLYCTYEFPNAWKASLEYQFHWSLYRGKVHDNLISNDLETQNNNKIWGNNITARFNSPFFYNYFALGLEGNYKYYTGKNGRNNIDNQSLKLKSVTWSSLSISLLLLGHF